MIRKKCYNCKKIIERNFNFCPWCGREFISKKKDDYGLLGEKDIDNFFDKSIMPMDKVFEKVFFDLNNLFSKNLAETDEIKLPFGNIQIKFSSVSRKNKSSGSNTNSNQQKKQRKSFIEHKVPIVRANAIFKRLPEGIVYEIFAPGIKSKEDVFINKIEDGIEIRAYTKDKCYVKTIPIKINSYSYAIKGDKIIFKIGE